MNGLHWTNVPIESWERLKLTKDRKVSPMGYPGGFIMRQNGKKKDRGMVAKIKNSFGLPGGHSCPGRTSFCDSCYAMRNSEVVFPNVGRAMWHNWDMLETFYMRYGMSGYIALLEEAVATYEKQAKYYELEPHEKIFRIHWDGDFFSGEYAFAWRSVIKRHPEVKFWVYTRSFDCVGSMGSLNVVPMLCDIENLQLYLSVDHDNAVIARLAIENFDYTGRVRIAACGKDYDDCKRILDKVRGIPNVSHRVDVTLPAPIACPENSRKIPLISDEGVGACVSCAVCIRGSRDIMFATSGLQSTVHPDQGVLLDYDFGREVRTDVRLPPPRRKGKEEARSSDQAQGPSGTGTQGALEV